jgi:hypothetical protein
MPAEEQPMLAVASSCTSCCHQVMQQEAGYEEVLNGLPPFEKTLSSKVV